MFLFFGQNLQCLTFIIFQSEFKNIVWLLRYKQNKTGTKNRKPSTLTDINTHHGFDIRGIYSHSPESGTKSGKLGHSITTTISNQWFQNCL